MAGIKDKEKRLPKGGDVPFIPKKTKDGKIPRNEHGDFLDKWGRGWRWDPIKNEWDVQIDGGEDHLNVDENGKITH